MKRVVLLGAAIALITLAGNASSAKAQMGCAAGGGWGGWGINWPYGLYGARIYQVPYYSMFPPVYYSQPVPRAYGWSPFAYPPGTMTPEVEVVEQPQEVINPYVPQPTEAKPSSTRDKLTANQGPVPQIMINPYVKSANLASAAGETR